LIEKPIGAAIDASLATADDSPPFMPVDRRTNGRILVMIVIPWRSGTNRGERHFPDPIQLAGW
jgi:hypothetical protein